jgi:hypothetical protein
MTDERHRILERIAVASFVTGILLALLGVYLVYLGATGEATIELLGQKINTTNVGIGAIFIAAVLIIFNLRRILTSFDKAGAQSAGKQAPGALKITELRAEQNRENKTCSVDFWVSNEGGSQVVITGVDFEVVDTARAEVVKGPMKASGEYNLDITELRETGQVASCPISQEVKPGESDRFTVILKAEELGTGIFAAWVLRPKLITNYGEVEAETVELWLPYNEGTTLEELKAIEETIRRHTTDLASEKQDADDE